MLKDMSVFLVKVTRFWPREVALTRKWKKKIFFSTLHRGSASQRYIEADFTLLRMAICRGELSTTI
jgi:hypothetical protein